MSLAAVRARAGRAAGPADPGLAVRLGGVDRPDRLLLRALGGLAQAPLRGGRWRPLGAGLSRVLLGLPVQILCGAIGVFLLGVAVYAGLRGTEAPDRNFALTFLFVTAWLGFPLFSVLLGDVFRPFNPWRAVGRAVGAGLRARSPGSGRPTSPIPERLGRWPAAVGLVAVVWLEIVYGASGGVAVGLSPARRRPSPPSSTASTRWR